MAHLIKEHDKAIRPASAPEAWHEYETVKLGRMIIHPEEITQASQMPEIACPIVKEEMPLPEGYALSGKNCTHQIVAKKPGLSIITATCSPEYQCIGNDLMFEKAMEAFSKHGIQAKLSFALTMDNLAQVAFCFQLLESQEFFVGGTDKHAIYLNLTGSNNKTLGKKVFGSTTRIVCNNTQQFALRGPKSIMNATFYHDKRGFDDFQNLPDLVEATLIHAAEYSKLAEKLGNFPINRFQAKAIAAQILAAGDAEISTRVYNDSEKIAHLFKNGKGNKGENMYDLLNGVTEYYTSGDGSGATGSAFSKAVSADYGNAATKKKDFVLSLQQEDGEVITQDMINQMIMEGEKLIKEKELLITSKLLAMA